MVIRPKASIRAKKVDEAFFDPAPGSAFDSASSFGFNSASSPVFGLVLLEKMYLSRIYPVVVKAAGTDTRMYPALGRWMTTSKAAEGRGPTGL